MATVEDLTATAGASPPTGRSSDKSWTVLTPRSAQRPEATAATTRYLVSAAARREVRSRYKQNAGRGVWMVVQPIAMVAIYGFVFTQIFDATGEGLPYLSMAWAGIILWQFFQHGVQIGMMSLIYEAGTLPKVWFPRVAVPLTPGTAAFADLGVGFVLLIALSSFQGFTPDYHAIGVVVPLAVVSLWMYALAMVLAPAAVFLRDLTTVIPLLLRLGFFASPVMYAIRTIPPELSWLGDVNPMAVGINGVRDTMIGRAWPDWTMLGYHGAAGLVLLLAAYWYFRQVEERLVDAL